jgi:hypothetical protein
VLAAYSIHVRFLAQFLKRLPALEDLELSLKRSTADFFKQLSKAVPSIALRSLKLSYIVTKYKYLAMFFDSCADTLSSLMLEYVDCNSTDDQWALCNYIMMLDLDDCVLRDLNFDGMGLRFGNVNQAQDSSSKSGAMQRSLADVHKVSSNSARTKEMTWRKGSGK